MVRSTALPQSPSPVRSLQLSRGKGRRAGPGESVLASHWVLIVDDEPLIRWSLRAHLEQAGYAVVDAETGRQALDRVGEQIGLALVDLRLPDTDGLQLILEIKRMLPDCRIILMTAYGSPEVAKEARKSGAYEVLDKPFDLKHLTATVAAALDSPA